MKVGDLVRFKNLHSDWGKAGLITKIHHTDYGGGQIYLLVRGGRTCTLPVLHKDKYIVEVINASR
jgi:hypothetical protein